MFSKVLKKFFTSDPQNENKRITNVLKRFTTGTKMITTLRHTARRNAHTLAEDALGVAALLVLLLGGLHLPMIF